MTLQEFLRTLWFGRWLVVVSVLAAALGAWVYVSEQVPAYSTDATVLLVDNETLTLAGLGLDSDPSLAASTAVAEAAAAALGDPALAEQISASTTGAYVADDPSLVVISVTDASPTRAVDIANAVAGAYAAQLAQQYTEDIAAMQARLDALATSIDQQQAAVNAQAEASPDGVAGGRIEAQYSASMDQYQTLSGQLVQAQLIAEPASIRQNAVSATLASTPPSLVYAVALLGGLLLGIGLAVMRRGLDTKVRTVGVARRAAGAPVLARLSGTAAAERSAERTGDLPVASRSATTYTQSIRELRTALQAAVEPDSGAVLVVTSADLETPRSFIAANLAASWALSGRKVVVLSGDLRQPRLNTMLPTAQQGRPAPVVTPDRTRAGASAGAPLAGPVATAIPHLSVHPALMTELDPADYLASDEVRTLIASLRESADVVIIDAPPMLVAADATILGAYADGVVLLATIGQARVTAIEESVERLRAANATVFGIALDGSNPGRSAYAPTYTFTGDTTAPAAPAAAAATAPAAPGRGPSAPVAATTSWERTGATLDNP